MDYDRARQGLEIEEKHPTPIIFYNPRTSIKPGSAPDPIILSSSLGVYKIFVNMTIICLLQLFYFYLDLERVTNFTTDQGKKRKCVEVS